MGLNEKFFKSAAGGVVATDNFNTVIYDGTGVSNLVTGVGFAADFIWFKGRDYADNHFFIDSVRGINKILLSNSTAAEATTTGGSIDSINDDGYTLQSTPPYYGINFPAKDQVAWNWKAGGAAVSNTDGTVTSQVSANVDAGFSIVSFSNNNNFSNTFGHGLDAQPELVFIKGVNFTVDWFTYVHSLGKDKRLKLNSSDAVSNWSSNDGTNTATGINDTTLSFAYSGTTYNFIAYCFHSVDGYQKIGIYSGNAASGSGTTQAIVTGFLPSWIMVKNITSGSSDWVITDSTRGLTKELYPDLPNIENTDSNGIQSFNSNGFTVGNGFNFNRSSNDYIYLAIA